MKIATGAPRRPALRYYGGKWRLAPWIISHFPPHQNYVEPCGGAASVLLQKPRSPLETYNDLDGNVVNFFRVLRDQPDELIRKIRLTPWARAEYELSLEPCEDVVERARRFFVAHWMSIGGGGKSADGPGSWRYVRNYKATSAELYHGGLMIAAERFYKVQIERLPALEVIARYDHIYGLIYFDPPYVAEERSHPDEYHLEWTDTDHEAAADLLRQCVGYVIVSGYACDLYRDLYEAHGWKRVDKEAQTNSGGKRIESLWLSPRTVEALAMPGQLTMEAL